MVDWTEPANLQQLVDYPMTVINAIAFDKHVAGLIMNDPDIDPYNIKQSPSFDLVRFRIYDFDFVPDFAEGENVYVCVESDVIRTDSGVLKDLLIYITVVCHKNYMELDDSPSMFKGIRGNRRDNVIKWIDKRLSNSRDYGLGKLKLDTVLTVSCAASHTAKQMTYSCTDFHGLQ